MTTIAADKRQLRGLALFDNPNSNVRRINKLHYRVKSQSDDSKWYDVVKQYGSNKGGHQEGEWKCSCPDFTYRAIVCKHIYVVSYLKHFHKKVTYQGVAEQPSSPVVLSTPSETKCPKCRLSEVVKDGRRYNKSGLIQKFLCRKCNYRFIVNVTTDSL